MRKTVTNEYLKKAMIELDEMGEDATYEIFQRVLWELRHSCLIIAGDIRGNEIYISKLSLPDGEYGLLFTDMDEYRKVFPNFEVEAHEHSIGIYKELISKSNLKGFIVNLEGECFGLFRSIFDEIGDAPQNAFSIDGSYTSVELKRLKDSINNRKLEDFINDPLNIGRYEELFEMISESTMLALRLARENVDGQAEDGIISMVETGPIGYLYMDGSGRYGTAFTSEEKITSVPVSWNRYSQIVNFYQIANSILSDDMDGIIINPNTDNILLTREVLLEYSNLLERTCNDHRLNSAIMHMFPIKGQMSI